MQMHLKSFIATDMLDLKETMFVFISWSDHIYFTRSTYFQFVSKHANTVNIMIDNVNFEL